MSCSPSSSATTSSTRLSTQFPCQLDSCDICNMDLFHVDLFQLINSSGLLGGSRRFGECASATVVSWIISAAPSFMHTATLSLGCGGRVHIAKCHTAPHRVRLRQSPSSISAQQNELSRQYSCLTESLRIRRSFPRQVTLHSLYSGPVFRLYLIICQLATRIPFIHSFRLR